MNAVRVLLPVLVAVAVFAWSCATQSSPTYGLEEPDYKKRQQEFMIVLAVIAVGFVIYFAFIKKK